MAKFLHTFPLLNFDSQLTAFPTQIYHIYCRVSCILKLHQLCKYFHYLTKYYRRFQSALHFEQCHLSARTGWQIFYYSTKYSKNTLEYFAFWVATFKTPEQLGKYFYYLTNIQRIFQSTFHFEKRYLKYSNSLKNIYTT